MSFHGQRLKRLRARAGLHPLPESFYLIGFVAGFPESIDPRFYSPSARHWYDQVCEYAETGAAIPASELAAFAMIGRVLRMARDERDDKKRRELFMPSAKAQRDFDAAECYRAAEFLKGELYGTELRRLGYEYGPDASFEDALPDMSADGLFDRTMSKRYGTTEGAVKQKRLRWRAAHRRSVRGCG